MVPIQVQTLQALRMLPGQTVIQRKAAAAGDAVADNCLKSCAGLHWEKVEPRADYAIRGSLPDGILVSWTARLLQDVLQVLVQVLRLPGAVQAAVLS